MPVTKTATRALGSSLRKRSVNRRIITAYEIAIRTARKSKKSEDVISATSLVDRAAKKKTIHKNKAARLKSQLARLAKTTKTSKSKK